MSPKMMRWAGVGVSMMSSGPPQVLGDQLPLRHQQGLDQVGGEETVLGHDARGQRQLGDAVGDDVEVRRLLGVGGEQLEEAGVVDAVVVVVAGVHVQGRLGHGAGADVEHVGQALAHRGVERLVHVGDALAGGKVGRPQPGHGQARGHRGRGVLALRFNEDQRPPGDVDVALGRGLGPVLAHLGGGGDGIGPGGVAGLALAHDDRGIAVHRRALARVFYCGVLLAHAVVPRCLGAACGRAQLGAAGSAPWRRIFLLAAPRSAPASSSIQTMAPVGQRSIGTRVAWGPV